MSASELAAASPLTRPVLRLVRPVGGRRDGTRAGVLAAARALTDEGHDTFSPTEIWERMGSDGAMVSVETVRRMTARLCEDGELERVRRGALRLGSAAQLN